jgi:hypothetical protein
MPRAPRIELAGAVYHVISRGNQRRAIFGDDKDRKIFVQTLKATQSSDQSYKHSMRPKNQSAADAIRQRDAFIDYMKKKARDAAKNGCREEALRLLGEAMHPLMDATSPLHVDKDGDPRVWDPMHPLGHSPNDMMGGESILDITPEIYQTEKTWLNAAYNCYELL